MRSDDSASEDIGEEAILRILLTEDCLLPSAQKTFI